MCEQSDPLLAKQLRLLHDPVVVSRDPAVREVLATLGDDEIDDLARVGSDLIFGSMSPQEYAARIAEVSVFVVPFAIPFSLRCFLDEARQCYGFGQFAAVQALSRTILESAVTELVIRSGKVPSGVPPETVRNKPDMKERIKMVAPKEAGPICSHYRDLCTVVHGSATEASAGALGSLTRMIAIVQRLYDSAACS